MASTSTKFGVARGEKIIGEVYPDIDTAKRQLAYIEESMRAADLDPDVNIVTVEEKTTYGRPKVYSEAVPEKPEPVEVPEQAD